MKAIGQTDAALAYARAWTKGQETFGYLLSRAALAAHRLLIKDGGWRWRTGRDGAPLTDKFIERDPGAAFGPLSRFWFQAGLFSCHQAGVWPVRPHQDGTFTPSGWRDQAATVCVLVAFIDDSKLAGGESPVLPPVTEVLAFDPVAPINAWTMHASGDWLGEDQWRQARAAGVPLRLYHNALAWLAGRARGEDGCCFLYTAHGRTWPDWRSLFGGIPEMAVDTPAMAKAIQKSFRRRPRTEPCPKLFVRRAGDGLLGVPR